MDALQKKSDLLSLDFTHKCSKHLRSPYLPFWKVGGSRSPMGGQDPSM